MKSQENLKIFDLYIVALYNPNVFFEDLLIKILHKYINKIYYDQVFDILLEDFERMFTIDFDIYSDLKESLYEVTDKVL